MSLSRIESSGSVKRREINSRAHETQREYTLTGRERDVPQRQRESKRKKEADFPSRLQSSIAGSQEICLAVSAIRETPEIQHEKTGERERRRVRGSYKRIIAVSSVLRLSHASAAGLANVLTGVTLPLRIASLIGGW